MNTLSKNLLKKDPSAAKLGKKFPQAAVKNFLKDNPHALVSYVRNKAGYVKGVVVAVAKDKIGWALVNHSADTDFAYKFTRQTPAFQRTQNYLRRASEAVEQVESEDLRRFLNSQILGAADANEATGKAIVAVDVPKFDRYEGLFTAFNRAFDEPVQFDFMDGDGIVLGTPEDYDLNLAIWNLAERTTKYYKA
jgi:hypothetical protein